MCEVEFKKRGWSGKGAYDIEGFAFDYKKEKKFKIWGKWTESLFIKNLETGKEEKIWEAFPMPEKSNMMYNFTLFTL